MTIRSTLFCWLVLFLGFFFARCNESPKVEQEEKIDYMSLIRGNWILKKAYRNKKESVGLVNTFFEFKEEGTLITNFNIEGKTDSHSYIVESDLIKQEGIPGFNYQIYEVSDSSLTLETNYRGFDFKLILEKWDKDGPQ